MLTGGLIYCIVVCPKEHWRMHKKECQVSEGCCVYCGESPEHAAMKRNRCGVCMKVIYCGVACQKAHWPVDKKECKA